MPCLVFPVSTHITRPPWFPAARVTPAASTREVAPIAAHRITSAALCQAYFSLPLYVHHFLKFILYYIMSLISIPFISNMVMQAFGVVTMERCDITICRNSVAAAIRATSRFQQTRVTHTAKSRSTQVICVGNIKPCKALCEYFSIIGQIISTRLTCNLIP